MNAIASPPVRGRSRRLRLTPKNAPYVFLLPVIVLFLAFKLYPYLSALWTSFTATGGGENRFVGIDNYSRLLADPLFYKALGNTVTILLVQLPIMLVIALLLAVAFNSALLKLRTFFRLAYFVPIVMGLVAYGILFSSLLSTDRGLVNELLGVFGIAPVPWLGDPFWAKISIIGALIWHYTGYNSIIFLAQLQTVPTELYEAASMDGAGAGKRFWHVTLPGVRPAIVLTLILTTVGTLQLFDEPYVLTNGGPDNATLTIGMYLYQTGFQYFDFGYASAIGYGLTLIIAVITMVQFWLLREKRS